jgi:hypothetical protein
MQLLDYLNLHFITREQLLARCGIEAAELERLQQAGMMPLPSYRLRLDVACESFFGMHAERAGIDYYAHGCVAWAGLLQALAGPDAARAVFARRYRARLAQLAAQGIAAGAPGLGGDAHVGVEWGHFLSGTYGLCTVSGLPEDIAAKEAAIVAIRAIIENEQALTDAQRGRLAHAVDVLDRVSKPFAAHEVTRSSRRRYVDDVRDKNRL